MHAACLLHDDIVDRCHERRGQPAFHLTHGTQAAVETGAYFVHVALELTGILPAFVRRRMAEATRLVARSELTEVARTFDMDIRLPERLVVMEEKTASVFGLACELGSFLARRSTKERTSAREYGLAFGTLYQIADDLDDLYASAGELGREPGADLREGILSLPLVCGLESPLRTDLIQLLESIRHEEHDGVGLEPVRMTLRRAGALEQVETLAVRFANRARASVHGMSSSEGTAWLSSMLDQTMTRIHDRLKRATTS